MDSKRGSKTVYQLVLNLDRILMGMQTFQVSKSCTRQQLPLSVTRGVRSRPLGDATSTKVETVPLLSPTMESELLKEPWIFPHTKASPMKEEDIAAPSAWEEDFQDLSSWCMDTFQGQCDFHIGESTTFKLSGTKYEGNGISTLEEEGLLKDLKGTTDDEKLDLKMDTVKTIKESNDNSHLLLSPSELVNEYGLGYNNEENNASSSCLMSPESTASKSTSSSKQHSLDISEPLQSESRDLDYACPLTSLDAAANQRETWDELRTIETTGSDTFDLLSYLWEDEMRSLEGVSTDSTAMMKHRPLAASSPVSFTSTKANTKELNKSTPPSTRRRMETRATSTVTSSTVKTPVTSSRRSERTKAAKSKEREKVAVTSTKEKDKHARKRYYESDSEDDVMLVQYRECREKNNEASRRSRMNKKAKESEMARKAIELEKDNKILKMKVEELEKLVTSMRNALLQSALKKEF